LHNFGKIEGYAEAQLVEALSYKPQGHRFDCCCGHWIDLFLPPAISPCKCFSL